MTDVQRAAEEIYLALDMGQARVLEEGWKLKGDQLPMVDPFGHDERLWLAKADVVRCIEQLIEKHVRRT